MLIEIHMLQNHAPSNLNRDDSGSPKDCIFGGIRRSRISSQCIKHSIRQSSLFQEGLQGAPLALRTRHLPDKIKEILLTNGVTEELAAIGAQKASGFGTADGKEQPKGKTAQIMFLADSDIQKIAEVILQAIKETASPAEFQKVPAKDLQAKAELRGWRPVTPDIALFGRMTTSEAFRDVEAAMQVAHALSTHKMDHEFDYFTAVDDLQGAGQEEEELGAGMIGDVEFNSACYYKYFSLDYKGLVDNLAGPAPGEKASKADREAYQNSRSEARRVAALTVPALIEAAVFTTPSGKQNSFAAHQLPDAVLVEIRPRPTPVSFSNAFIKPAQAHGSVDLIEDSIAKLTGYADTLTRKFSLESSARLWFCTREMNLNGATNCDSLKDMLAMVRQAVEAGDGLHE